MRFRNQHLVVVGGSSGIGLETARQALTEGASVTIAGRSAGRLRQAVEGLDDRYGNAAGAAKTSRIRSAVADVGDDSSIQALFAAEQKVDHLFLPAGELRPGGGDLLESDMDGLRSILDVRLLGIGRVIRHARAKLTAGSIVLMSGLYSSRPAQHGALAAGAVAAVEGITRALALDLAPVRVNAVAPGLIDTPLWDTFGPQREAILSRGAKMPVGRAGRPEDVAEAVLFLMSNGYITGTILPVDGGGSLV
jgi:NAD(P)-dependent dehydrogenase (short-subunit alcohol dehydrogenase family)